MPQKQYRDTQINVMVTSEEKERWEEYYQDTRVAANMSEFIRGTVNNEITTQKESSSSEEPGIDTETVGEIQSTLNRLETGLSEVAERLDTIERDVRLSEQESASTDKNNIDLQRTIYSLLPEESIGNRTPSDVGISLGEIAARLGTDEDRIETILDSLKRTTTVRSGFIDERSQQGPATYFWREAGDSYGSDTERDDE